MADFYARNKKNLDKLIISGLFVMGAYVFVKVLFQYIAPFAVGWLFAALFEPLVSKLSTRFKMHRGLLAFLAILLVLVVIGSLGSLITVRIINEAYALSEALPEHVEALSQSFENLRENYLTITEHIPEELREAADAFGSSLMGSVTLAVGEFVRRISGSAVKVVPSTVIGMILCFISMFFFIKDRDIIVDTIASKTPRAVKEKYFVVKRELLGALAGYIRASAMLMLITGLICISGLIILRYPYALFLGLVVAVFDFLPVFGPGIILWPWAIASAISSDFQMAIGLILIYAVITVARQILEPKILGSQLGIHPLVMLMSMFMGLQVFGLLGFLIGPFVVILLKAIFETGDRQLSGGRFS